MKNRIITLLLAIASALTIHAQVLNSSFENLNSDSTIRNWGNVVLLAITIDSTGNQTDSLAIDHNFYFSTTDAHSGSRALEMRNAMFYVSGQQIAGAAKMQTNDSEYSSFSSPVPLLSRPTAFSFYYKFLPAGNDTAYAWMKIYDNFNNQIGESEIKISGNIPNYTLASAPVTYLTTDSAAFMEIGFRTATPYSAANYGTRFLVDDVNLIVNGLNENETETNFISSYPNPATDELTLDLKKMYSGNVSVEVYDVCGKLISTLPYTISGNALKADVENLKSGCYIIKVNANNERYISRFVK